MKDRKKSHNVVWIEIEKFDDKEKNEAAAAAVSKMLAKLEVKGKFEWFEAQATYIFISPDGSFWELPKGGHSFNLDYLAK